MNKQLKVKCPNCETEFQYYDSKFRPFCSERCKMIDLGHWFEETYRVPLKQNTPGNADDFEESNDQENFPTEDSEEDSESYH